jgi:hypothetical protein
MTSPMPSTVARMNPYGEAMSAAQPRADRLSAALTINAIDNRL